MKKFQRMFALVLSLAMVLSLLAGCGNKSGGEDKPSSDSAETGYSGPEFTFKMQTTANPGSHMANTFDYFCDYVEEATGGKVKFTRFYSGTICSSPETLDYLQTGALDMALMTLNPFSAKLPLINFPNTVVAPEGVSSSEYGWGYAQHVAFENEETAALIKAEFESQGIEVLSFTCSGANGFAAVPEFDSLSDLKGMRMGNSMHSDVYTALGFKVIDLLPKEMYDAFERGIVDCSQLNVSSMLKYMWYEKATHVMLDNTNGGGSTFSVSLDVWNNCGEELQQILKEAALKAGQYSVELDKEATQDAIATLTENGSTVGTLPQEECELFGTLLFETSVKNCRDRAAQSNVTDEMELVLAAAAAYIGVELE